MNNKFVKKLTLISTSLMLAGTVTAIAAQPVSAITAKQRHLIKNSIHYHKVKLTKKIAVRKIHKRIPTYKSTLGPKQYLRKGKTVRILQLGTDFGWYMHIPGRSGDYTIVKRYNDYSWFKLM